MRMDTPLLVFAILALIGIGADSVINNPESALEPEDRLWVYDAPGQEDYQSEHYLVSIEQASQTKEVFCYRTRSIWHNEFPDQWVAKHFPKDNNWVTFSFSGKVTVVVEPLKVKATDVEVRPDPPGVKAIRDKGRIRVELTRPGQYYIMVKTGDEEHHGFDHPLFLFANPPETDVPYEGEPGVHYFGPGVHDIGFQYHVRAGETVYLAGGAMVRGSLYYEGSGVKIMGRGILTDRAQMMKRVESALAEKAAGKSDPWELNHDRMYQDKWATIYGDSSGSEALVEGITIIESPFYMVRTHGPNSIFRNVKLMGDLYNNNGIIGGTNHKILDSFFKVEDDIFCWMEPISETRNCVFWKQDNGSLVQLGYGYEYATHGHRMIDNWVIMDTATTQIGYRALFSLASSAGTTFKDCHIENLKVYGDVLSFLAIDNWWRTTPWANQSQKDFKLRPIELSFKNVEITGTERGSYWGKQVEAFKDTPMRSYLRTENEGTIHIILENVRINGKILRSDEDWPNGLMKQGQVTVEYR